MIDQFYITYCIALTSTPLQLSKIIKEMNRQILAISLDGFP